MLHVKDTCLIVFTNIDYLVVKMFCVQVKSIQCYCPSIINKATARSVHYQLNNYLLDRNLLKFIQLISEYYPTDSLRPRYYAEAYKLYTLLSKGLKPKYPYAKGSYTNYYFSTKN